jgi:hypothetical protein
MKTSRYNFLWEIDGLDKVLLYNSLTNTLVELNLYAHSMFLK